MSSPKFAKAKAGALADMITACYKHQSDTFEQKIDMIPGVYKTGDGKPYVLPFVKELERSMMNSPDYNHDYILFLGNEKLNILAPRLILGEDNPVIKEGRALAVQSIGGCGALRMGAELLTQHANFTIVYFSEPTWDNHETTFLNGGFKESRKYRYHDPATNGIDFNGMMEDLAQAPENSVIVLQACAHNPTGCDLTRDQWRKVATVLKERNLLPFFDAAYQGFATGDLDEDAWPVRYFVNQGFEMLIAQSFSKNLGLYGDRIGCLTLVLGEGRQQEIPNIRMLLTVIARGLCLCPARYGASIVVGVLENPEYIKQWKKCLQEITSRLKTARKDLRDELLKLGTPGNWDHIVNQIGMFSYTGLTANQVAHLATKHHIHALPTGRANMCAINSSNARHIAEAIYNTVVNISD